MVRIIRTGELEVRQELKGADGINWADLRVADDIPGKILVPLAKTRRAVSTGVLPKEDSGISLRIA